MSARTPEGRISKKIIDHLNAQPNTMAWKVAAGQYNIVGLPDIAAVQLGRAIFLETKRPGTEEAIVKAVRPIQAVRLRHLAEAGALVGIVTSVEEVVALLDCPPELHALTARVRARMAAAVVGSMT